MFILVIHCMSLRLSWGIAYFWGLFIGPIFSMNTHIFKKIFLTLYFEIILDLKLQNNAEFQFILQPVFPDVILHNYSTAIKTKK